MGAMSAALDMNKETLPYFLRDLSFNIEDSPFFQFNAVTGGFFSLTFILHKFSF